MLPNWFTVGETHYLVSRLFWFCSKGEGFSFQVDTNIFGLYVFSVEKKKKKWLAAQIAGADMIFQTIRQVLQLPLQFHPLGNGNCNSLQPQEWMKNSQHKRNSNNVHEVYG